MTECFLITQQFWCKQLFLSFSFMMRLDGVVSVVVHYIPCTNNTLDSYDYHHTTMIKNLTFMILLVVEILYLEITTTPEYL